MQSRTLVAQAGAILLLSLVPMLAAPPHGATTAPDSPRAASPGAPTLALPDLVIAQITTARGARAQIKNQGKANAPGCTLVANCSLGSTASGVSAKAAASWTVPALKPGAAVWISLGSCTPVGAVIDSDKVVKESSESNNTYSVDG